MVKRERDPIKAVKKIPGQAVAPAIRDVSDAVKHRVTQMPTGMSGAQSDLALELDRLENKLEKFVNEFHLVWRTYPEKAENILRNLLQELSPHDRVSFLVKIFPRLNAAERVRFLLLFQKYNGLTNKEFLDILIEGIQYCPKSLVPTVFTLLTVVCQDPNMVTLIGDARFFLNILAMQQCEGEVKMQMIEILLQALPQKNQRIQMLAELLKILQSTESLGSLERSILLDLVITLGHEGEFRTTQGIILKALEQLCFQVASASGRKIRTPYYEHLQAELTKLQEYMHLGGKVSAGEGEIQCILRAVQSGISKIHNYLGRKPHDDFVPGVVAAPAKIPTPIPAEPITVLPEKPDQAFRCHILGHAEYQEGVKGVNKDNLCYTLQEHILFMGYICAHHWKPNTESKPIIVTDKWLSKLGIKNIQFQCTKNHISITLQVPPRLQYEFVLNLETGKIVDNVPIPIFGPIAQAYALAQIIESGEKVGVGPEMQEQLEQVKDSLGLLDKHRVKIADSSHASPPGPTTNPEQQKILPVTFAENFLCDIGDIGQEELRQYITERLSLYEPKDLFHKNKKLTSQVYSRKRLGRKRVCYVVKHDVIMVLCCFIKRENYDAIDKRLEKGTRLGEEMLAFLKNGEK